MTKKKARVKFKGINVFPCENKDLSSIDSTNAYRTVFGKKEGNYFMIEVEVYNKWFAEKDALLQGELIVRSGNGNKLFSTNIDKHLSANDNIISIQHFAAVKYFKKKGVYVINFTPDRIDDVWTYFTKTIFILDGTVTQQDNPFFNIASVHLFNRNNDINSENIEGRDYVKVIKKVSRAAIEIILENKSKESTAKMELGIEAYDQNKKLIGLDVHSFELFKDKDGSKYRTDFVLGKEIRSHLKRGKYYLQIRTMGVPLGYIAFGVGEIEDNSKTGFIKGNVLQKQEIKEVHLKTIEDIERETQKAFEDLKKLIGLSAIKEQIKDITNYIKYQQLRNQQGIKDEHELKLHSVFSGNPGTGKTTVAKLLGKVYKALGVLSKGDVLEVGRAELVGQYVGHTAPKTKAQIEKARGGILFIDEAYSLAREGNDFGKEAIEVLLKELSDGAGDLAIIVAGYPKEMQGFMDMNPGLKSRFSYTFHFEDYTPDELLEIALLIAKKNQVVLNQESTEFLRAKLIQRYRDRTNTSGNARYINSLIHKAKMNAAQRLMESSASPDLSKETLSTIVLEDISPFFQDEKDKTVQFKIDPEIAREALDELDQLTGLSSIKEEVNKLYKLIQYYNEIGKDVTGALSLHSVFKGNPGTGKTTVARILAKIFKGFGLIERGHLVECDREDLVAGYSGQTAIKTKEKIDQSMGGVLFIDEAYSLTRGADDGLGLEAIEILLKEMEDRRGKFIVIVAGYPNEMNEFLESNPGLKSRFDREFNFEDFLPEELMIIAEKLLNKEQLKFNNEARITLLQHLMSMVEEKSENFGNARTVRKAISAIIMNQNLRMAMLKSEERTPEMIGTVTGQDVEKFIAS